MRESESPRTVSDSQFQHFMALSGTGAADIGVPVPSGMVRGVAKAPEIDPADIKTMMDTNVHGLINMTQAVMPIFKKRPNGGIGDIINIGSIAGREGYPGGSIYCATKAAVRAFTEAMRKENIASRIRIMEIDPGQVETEFSVVRFGGDKAKADAVYAGCEPLTPDDIAEIIVFMAGRRQNVVVADTLVFPSHQVCLCFLTAMHCCMLTRERLQQQFCTRHNKFIVKLNTSISIFITPYPSCALQSSTAAFLHRQKVRDRNSGSEKLHRNPDLV